MTRCPEFYEKLEKDGNFCGLSPSEISRIKAYRELIDKISKMGIDRTLAYEHFPAGAARELTSLKDDEVRIKGLNYVVTCLKRNEKITAGDLQNTLSGFSGSRSKKLPFGKNKTHPVPHLPKEPQIEKPSAEHEKEPLPVEIPIENTVPSTPIAKEPVIEQPIEFPCNNGLKCGLKYFKIEVIRGKVCTNCNMRITELPGNICPFESDLRARKEAAADQEKFQGGFTQAGQPSTQTGLPHAYPKKTQLSLKDRDEFTRQFCTKCLSPKQIEILDDAVKTGEMGDCWFDVISSAVDDVGERMGGK
jgi:hypothetical protein